LLAQILHGRAPPHGIGRGFKAGKEEIIGLLVALERFAATDDAAETAELEARLAAISAALNGLDGVRAELQRGGRSPQLALLLDPPERAQEAVARLMAHTPPVHVGERRLSEGVLLIDPQSLAPEDDATLATALRAACSG